MSCGCDSNSEFVDLGELKRGASFLGLSFQILEDDEVTPQDLTGATFLMQLRLSPNGKVFYEFSSQKGNITVVDGWVVVAAVNEGFQFPENDYLFDMRFTNSAGIKRVIFKGKISLVDVISN
jgi:hypothetical protein